MNDVQITPPLLQVLSHQPAMAVVRLVLAAKKTALGDHFLRNAILNPPFFHEVEKPLLVGCPTALELLYWSSISCVGASSRRWT
jgi:hypothetical protein